MKVRGWLAFPASKSSISFLPEDRQDSAQEQYPWDALLADDDLLRRFLERFRLNRLHGEKMLFTYYLDVPVSELDAWFAKNVEIIEIDE